MVGIRPRTKFNLETKERRCPKCGAKVNNQRVRCKKCAGELSRPVKSRTKKRKHRVGTRARQTAKASGKK
jgi:predicted amidophosphoribosyltransferase